jgi:hypothetical protein
MIKAADKKLLRQIPPEDTETDEFSTVRKFRIKRMQEM